MKNSICLLLAVLFTLAGYSQKKGDFFIDQAIDHFNKKNYEMALDFIKQALDQDNDNKAAIYWRGVLRTHTKDYSGAEKDFNRLLKEKSDDYAALIGRGILFSAQKEYDKAIADFTSAIESQPHDDAAYYNRAQTFIKMRQHARAIHDLNKAITISPKNANYMEYRAECYNYTDQPDLAIADLEVVIRLDSSKTDAMQNVAFCYITKKQYSKSDSLYSRLFKIKPEDPYVLSNYGYVKHKLGLSEEGLKMINQSLLIMPKNSFAYKYLGLIYVDQHKSKEACDAFEKGLRLGYTAMYGNELQELSNAHCGR